MVPSPTDSVLIKLASLAVHVAEGVGDSGHEFDVVAARSITEDPEVKAWLSDVPAVLLPEVRS